MSEFVSTRLFVDGTGHWAAEVRTFDCCVLYGHFKRYELAINYVRNILGVLDYWVDMHNCPDLMECIAPEW